MIKIIAKNRLKEGTKDQALALFDEMIAATRQEAGCIKYELYELEDDSNTLTCIEEWEGPEYLDAHLNSEHFQRLIPQIDAYKQSNDPIEVYTPIK
jgi:quinol monooxygenase YgiN